MTASYGPGNGDKAQTQKNPVHAVRHGESLLMVALSVFCGPFTQHEGFHHEQHQGKDQPNQNHGMHPPEAKFCKATPCVEDMQHIESTQADNKRGEARLGSEAAFDTAKKLRSLSRGLQLRHGWKQHDGDHCDPANP